MATNLGGNPFAQGSGRWATEQFLRALKENKPVNAGLLRTLDTLRHDEWKHFDEALVQEALRQLKGVADLQAEGLTRPVPNSLGKTVFAYEKITFMDAAQVSMFGETATDNDREEYLPAFAPLPMTHKDFRIDLRTLVASRDRGEPLDTTQVRTAGRVISEMAEQMLFQGGPTFGQLPIYGYTTFPQRHQVPFGTGGNWDTTNTGKTSDEVIQDVFTAIQTLENDRFFGPYWVYVSRSASLRLSSDYVPNSVTGLSTKTLKERILQIEGVKKVEAVDFLPTSTTIVVNATMDTICWVQGETLQTVQWDTDGGFNIRFKAFQIGIPLIRSDAQGRCGVVHMS